MIQWAYIYKTIYILMIPWRYSSISTLSLNIRLTWQHFLDIRRLIKVNTFKPESITFCTNTHSSFWVPHLCELYFIHRVSSVKKLWNYLWFLLCFNWHPIHFQIPSRIHIKCILKSPFLIDYIVTALVKSNFFIT